MAFADTMTHAVFGPQWHVPRSIAKEDVLPAVQRDSTFLQQRNYQVLGVSGDTLGAGALTKEAVERGEVQLVQKAGPGNALGRVKFLFPNDYAIYFHDTPAQAAFERTDRAKSHGCVRLDDPLAFAEYAFDEERLPRDSLKTLMNESTEQREWLRDPLPVYMVYIIAWMSPDGTVHFRNDIYDNDADLRPVLGSPEPAMNACSVIQNSTDLGTNPIGLSDSTGRRF